MNSTCLKVSIYILSLFSFSTAIAQETTTFADKVYIDVRAGSNCFPFALTSQLLVASGWRFNEQQAIGIGYRRESASGLYNHNTMQGLGIDYRLVINKKYVFKAGVGTVLDAYAGNEIDKGEYKEGGTFYALSADHVFRGGFTLGLWISVIDNVKLDNYSDNYFIDGSEGFTFTGVITEGFGTLGITLGYSWPSRKRRIKAKRKAQKTSDSQNNPN